MTPPATVTDTDSVSSNGPAVLLDAVLRCTAVPEVGERVEAFALAIGMQHFALLQLVGPERRVTDVFHNLPATAVERIATSECVALLASRMLPMVLPDDLGVRELTHAIGVSMHDNGRSVVLLAGRQDPALSDALLGEQLGLGLLACTNALSVLRVLQPATQATARMLECLRYAAAGYSAKETAQRLGISHRTVEEYIERCRMRFQVNTTLAAAMAAIREGLMTHEELEALCDDKISRRYGADRG